MAIETSCPECKASYRLPDEQDGKKVRCKSCSATFLATADDQVPTLEEATSADLRPSSSRDDYRPSSSRRARDEDYEDDRPSRRRYDDEDDAYDEPRPQGSKVGLIIGIVAGVFVLLCGGGVVAWVLMSDSSSDSTTPVASTNPGTTVNPPINPPFNPPFNPPVENKDRQPTPPGRDPFAAPRDLTEAVADLRDSHRRRAAIEWLRTAPVEAARRDEVTRALEGLFDDPFHKVDALRLFIRWGGKPSTERLLTLLDNHDQQVWQPAMELLAKMDDDNAIEAVCKQLTAFGRTIQASRALQSSPPRRAEKFVLRYMHHVEAPVREESLRLLRIYSTPLPLLIEQTNSELDSRDRRVRHSACDWLVKQRPPTGEAQDRVARTLEGMLTDADIGIRQEAIKALDKWATKDTVKALCQALGDDQLRKPAVAILARMKDESSIAPLMLHLNKPGEREEIAKILIGFGKKAEIAVQRQLTNADPTTRRVACVILAEIGTKESLTLLNKFSAADRANRDVAQAAMKKIRERMK
jgi:predicted Zn finger-like uncharacterized protein